MVAPAKPGESDVEINSHFIVLEKVHDPALEAEATAAYPAPLTVAFRLTPRTEVCLHDVVASITATWGTIRKAGIPIYGLGQGTTRAVVEVTSCTPKSKKLAKRWFGQRWGAAVQVVTCGVIPTAQAFSCAKRPAPCLEGRHWRSSVNGPGPQPWPRLIQS
jgi:hypothetical protein